MRTFTETLKVYDGSSFAFFSLFTENPILFCGCRIIIPFTFTEILNRESQASQKFVLDSLEQIATI